MTGRKTIMAVLCIVLSAVFFLAVTGTCLGGGALQDTPLGRSLARLDNGTGGVSWNGSGSAEGTFSGNGSSVGGSVSWESSGSTSLNSPSIPSSGAPQLPVPEAPQLPVPLPGDTTQPPSLPLPEPGNAPGLPGLPGPDSLEGVLDPSNLSGLLPDAGGMPSPGMLPGVLDPTAFPGLEDLPGVDELISNLPAPPAGPGTPSLPSPDFKPEDLLKIVEKSDRILVLVSLDDLLQARLGLGKDLKTAPLLEWQFILFKALAAEGKLGVRKVSDDAFLVPLELYLKYWAGDQGWQEIFNLLLPLEISFPGAGMLPDGMQDLLDNLYEYLLKPILPLLPIYQPAEEPPAVEPPAPEEEAPSVEVGGVVVANPQQETGGLGDHLPFTGAELGLLLAIIIALSTAGLLLGRLERRYKNKTGEL